MARDVSEMVKNFALLSINFYTLPHRWTHRSKCKVLQIWIEDLKRSLAIKIEKHKKRRSKMLSFHQNLIIALSQSIVTRYGAVLDEKDIGEIFGLSETTIRNKFTQGAKDLPSYTQLKGKRVVMANDLADFMVHNRLKF